jgi:hypothetical protein
MSRMSELAADVETARNLAGPEHEIGMDVTRLMNTVVDLLGHSQTNPELLARDYAIIAASHIQLGRVLSRLSVKETAA